MTVLLIFRLSLNLSFISTTKEHGIINLYSIHFTTLSWRQNDQQVTISKLILFACLKINKYFIMFLGSLVQITSLPYIKNSWIFLRTWEYASLGNNNVYIWFLSHQNVLTGRIIFLALTKQVECSKAVEEGCFLFENNFWQVECFINFKILQR